MPADATDPRAAEWRARAWAAGGELLLLGSAGPAAHRSVLRVGDVIGADLGVPHPWGVRITAGDGLPLADDARTGLAWCRERGARTGWRVCVPERLVGTGPWQGLVERDRSGVFATSATVAAALDPGPTGGVELVDEPTRTEIVAAYGGWMSDPSLAELLVTPDDVERPDRRFLVARLDGSAVGCAFVWWAAGTGYLSGIGVVPHLRGRGIGRLLTAAAARTAAAGPGGEPPDVVWMHATPAGAQLYDRMGFRLVDAEVLVGPA